MAFQVKTKVNFVIKLFVAVDFLYNFAFGSFGPILAIFVTQQITGGSAKVAGFATAAYWVVKSSLQLPIARFLDKTDGERDDFWAMFLGYFLSSFTPFLYLLATTPTGLYLAQAYLGFMMAWAVPAWYGVFTRHLDRHDVSFEWSLESVFSLGLATAASAALGGFLVDRYGFHVVFIGAGILSMMASLCLIPLRRHLIPRIRHGKTLPLEHKS